MLHYAPLYCKAQRKVNRNFFEFQIFLYFCGEYCNTKVKLNNTNKSHSGAKKKPGQSDELYQANSVAYIEADLKLNHLRILMAIILHLQGAIRFKVNRPAGWKGMPEVILPPSSTDTRLGKVRILDIPVSDFHMGLNNGGRLRTCLEELSQTRIVFPHSSHYYLDTYPGLIAGYEFPSYSKSVRIILPEQMVGRLLLTEEGYSHYSHSKALSLNNKYTLRLYWLICSWRNRGGFVITLDNLRKILQLSPSYERYCNITARVLNPSREELRTNFPICFLYRLYKRSEGPVLAFKIKVKLASEEETRLRKDAYEFCYRLLSKSGIPLNSFPALFDSVETEDIKPFVNKLTDVVSYMNEHGEIRNRDQYLRSSLDAWLSDWSVRYQDITD